MRFKFHDVLKHPAYHELMSAGIIFNGWLLEIDELKAHEILLKHPQPLEPMPEPAAKSLLFDSRLCTADEQAARLAICEDCDKNLDGKCSLCSNCGDRPVTAKVKLSTEFCPLAKWRAL